MEGEKEYLIIGKVLKPFGREGEIKILPITDDINRFKDIKYIYISKYGHYIKLDVEKVRIANKHVLLRVKGYLTIDDAEKLRGKYLYIDRENAVSLKKGSYYYYDLWKCKVVTDSGDEIGIVEDIQNAGSCDVYVVRSFSNDETIYIPAISDVVKKIDIKSKKIEIKVIDGLF